MPLTADEMILFRAACHDRSNLHAQHLLNLFATAESSDVLAQVHQAPVAIGAHVMTYVWHAIVHEASRRDPALRAAYEREHRPRFLASPEA